MGTFYFTHDETPNDCVGVNCANDLVTVDTFLNAYFTYEGEDYYFSLLGFSQDGGLTFDAEYSTVENQANTAVLYGKITETPIPEPITLLLLGLGLVGVAGVRRKLK